MRIKFTIFIFAVLFTIILSGLIFGQEKSTALKFDEFIPRTIKEDKEDTVGKRFNRFAEQLKKNPQMLALIVRYSPRKQFYDKSGYFNAKTYLLFALRRLESSGVAESRIKTIDGGIREDETFEFWIMPKGAVLPEPAPEFKQADVISCPQVVEITGESNIFDRSKPLEFSARVYEKDVSQTLSYRWEVSTGKIIEGQGTDKLKIDFSETDGQLFNSKINR